MVANPFASMMKIMGGGLSGSPAGRGNFEQFGPGGGQPAGGFPSEEMMRQFLEQDPPQDGQFEPTGVEQYGQ